jgi:(1->4)-alpha-D-glucan 1-alpha-D-glucosylmutase
MITRCNHLFAHGSYTPVEVSGPRRDNVVAFARRWQKRIVVTIAARHFTKLPEDTGEIRGSTARAWADTQIHFPEDWAIKDFSDALTGAAATTSHGSLPQARVFGSLPFAVLVGAETAPGSDDLPR